MQPPRKTLAMAKVERVSLKSNAVVGLAVSNLGKSVLVLCWFPQISVYLFWGTGEGNDVHQLFFQRSMPL